MSILVFLLSYFNLVAQYTTGNEAAYNFTEGEHLEFKLGYGWFTIGKATLDIRGDFTYSDEDCYKVQLVGETAGLLGVFANVHDEWGAYIEKDSLKPLLSYQDIREGKYTRNERAFFDFEKGKLEVLRYDKKKEPKVFDIGPNVNDILSAYLKVRNIDFFSFRKGDTVSIRTFYDHLFYDIVILYDGVEQIKTKMGKLNAHKVYFLIPENDVFPERGGVAGWISADNNQLPLKIEAEMFFGSAYCDLVSYKNIKYGPDFKD